MTPLLLLLLSSLAWSGLDVSRKVLAGRLDALPLVVALSLGQGLVLVAGLAATGFGPIAPAFYAPAAGSVVLNVIGNMLFVRSVAVSPFATVVPLLALVPVGATLAALAVLGEVPTARQFGGILMIVAAAWVVAKPPAGTLGREPGVWPMLGVAACWALVGPLDKAATLASSPACQAATIYVGVAALLLPVLVFRRRPAPPAYPPPSRGATALWLVIGTVTGVVAIVAQFAAMQALLVGLVEAVKRMIGLLAAVLVGRFAFGEAIGKERLAAIAVMGVGTALLLL